MKYLTDNSLAANLSDPEQKSMLAGFYAEPNAVPIEVMTNPFMFVSKDRYVDIQDRDQEYEMVIVKSTEDGSLHLVLNRIKEMTQLEYSQQIAEEIRLGELWGDYDEH